jgi:diguanylate cyclase (GGDEF)-like protein
MEQEALELAENGGLDEAKAIIESTRYSYLVNIYYEGLGAIERRAEAYVVATEKKLNWYLAATLALSFAALGIVAFGWVSLLRPTRRWGQQIDEARQAAESANRELARSRTDLQVLNRQLYEQARVDNLTKLLTRLKFHEDLEHLWPRIARYGENYCAIMCDIDNFKQYNDTYGHIAGDRTLKQVADALTSECRGGDRIYRFGGEEFVIILPNCGIESGKVSAERYRKSVEELSIPHSGSATGFVTISMGVASVDDGHTKTLDSWLAAADAALYKAKRAGRNMVVASVAASA